MVKVVRFILRFVLLAIAILLGIEVVKFFYGFHTLSIDEVSGMLALISAEPLVSIGLTIGLLLFSLSLLGLIMLMQYQIWRYPISIFVGYIVGAFIMHWFYLLHPFQETVLHLNADAWYYPFIIATALLLRAIIGIKIPKRKKQESLV